MEVQRWLQVQQGQSQNPESRFFHVVDHNKACANVLYANTVFKMEFQAYSLLYGKIAYRALHLITMHKVVNSNEVSSLFKRIPRKPRSFPPRNRCDFTLVRSKTSLPYMQKICDNAE
jgi:hypothetical protein